MMCTVDRYTRYWLVCGVCGKRCTDNTDWPNNKCSVLNTSSTPHVIYPNPTRSAVQQYYYFAEQLVRSLL